MITIVYRNQDKTLGTIEADTLDQIEEALMEAQTFGSYPAYSWDDDEQDWDSFDGRIWEHKNDPRLTEDDLEDYARWSLNTGNPNTTRTVVAIYTDGIDATGYSTLAEAIAAQIEYPIEATGEAKAEEYNIDTIADEVLARTNNCRDGYGFFCPVDPEDFWASVERHAL